MEKYAFRLKGALGPDFGSSRQAEQAAAEAGPHAVLYTTGPRKSDIALFLDRLPTGSVITVDVAGEVDGPNLEAAAVVMPLLEDFRILCPGGVEHEFKRVRQTKAKAEAGPAE